MVQLHPYQYKQVDQMNMVHSTVEGKLPTRCQRKRGEMTHMGKTEVWSRIIDETLEGKEHTYTSGDLSNDGLNFIVYLFQGLARFTNVCRLCSIPSAL